MLKFFVDTEQRLIGMVEEQHIVKTKENISPSQLKDQIFGLKKQLNALHTEKEQWYAKREALSKQVKEEIAKIKDSTKERDDLTASVKEQKNTRFALNKQLFEKINEAKKLRKDVTDTKINPEALKKQINALEKRIETEAVSFDKEKELMKQIKERKKLYDEAKREQEKWSRVKGLSHEITALKTQADAAHKDVQETASTSQEKHDAVVTTSKLIDGLKKQERNAHNKFIELKQKFTEANNQLKLLLPSLKKIKEAEDAVRKKKQHWHESKKNRTLQQKVQEVEEKLKKRTKLTVEDLLAFQAKR